MPSLPCIEGLRQAFVRKLWKSLQQTSGIPKHISMGRWSRFLHWCQGQNIAPCKTTVWQITKFFLYRHRLLLPAVKACRAALHHVFVLASTDLAANKVISRIFSSFEKNLLAKEIKPQLEPVSVSKDPCPSAIWAFETVLG